MKRKVSDNVYVTLVCFRCGNKITDYFCHFEENGIRTCFRTKCTKCIQTVFHQFQNCPHENCKLRVECLSWPQSQVLKVSHPYAVGWPNV